MSSGPLSVAVAQMDPKLGQSAANLRTIQAMGEEAFAHGARLVVFPECALSGYGFASLEEARPVAEPIPGPATLALQALCARYQSYLVAGLLERAGDAVYNSAVLLGPEGLIGTYRKIHLPWLGVDRFVTPGDQGFKVWETAIGRIGIAICYDLRFPESLRVLALQGADIIALPTNWPDTSQLMPEFVTRTRALENRVYLLACNRVGEESGFWFFGRSQIVGTSGKVLIEAGELPEIAYASIDPLRARQKRLILRPGEFEMDTVGDRRPEWYGPIVEKDAS